MNNLVWQRFYLPFQKEEKGKLCVVPFELRSTVEWRSLLHSVPNLINSNWVSTTWDWNHPTNIQLTLIFLMHSASVQHIYKHLVCVSSHSDTYMCLSVHTTPSSGNWRDRRVEGDSPDTRGLAYMGCPCWLVALPGTIFAIWLCWALAFLLIIFLIIELLDPVLVAYLKQVGIGLQGRAGGYAVLFMNLHTPSPTTTKTGSTHILIISI